MIKIFNIGYVFGRWFGHLVQRFLFWIYWKSISTLSSSDWVVKMELKRIIKKRKMKNARGNRGR